MLVSSPMSHSRPYSRRALAMAAVCAATFALMMQTSPAQAAIALFG